MSLDAARTKIDVLYHDVLGEVDQLLERAETVIQQSHTLLDKTEALPADLQHVLANHQSRLSADAVRSLKHVSAQLDQMSTAARVTHDRMEYTSRRLDRLIFTLSIMIGLLIVVVGAVTGTLLYTMVM